VISPLGPRRSYDRNDKASTSKQAGQQAEPTSEILQLVHWQDSMPLHVGMNAD
jgi:hypothetical protein